MLLVFRQKTQPVPIIDQDIHIAGSSRLGGENHPAMLSTASRVLVPIIWIVVPLA